MLGVTGGLAILTTVVGVLTDFDDDEEEDDAAPVVSASVTPVPGGAVVGARWMR